MHTFQLPFVFLMENVILCGHYFCEDQTLLHFQRIFVFPSKKCNHICAESTDHLHYHWKTFILLFKWKLLIFCSKLKMFLLKQKIFYNKKQSSSSNFTRNLGFWAAKLPFPLHITKNAIYKWDFLITTEFWMADELIDHRYHFFKKVWVCEM